MSVTATHAPPRESAGDRPPDRPRPRAGWRPSFNQIVLGVPIVFMSIMYAYPVAAVLFRSLTDAEPGVGNFVDAVQDPIVLRVLWITVRLALEVAVITAVLGFPVAYFMTTLTPRWARMVGLLVIIPFWTSVLVRSFAWIVLLGDDGVVAKLLEPVRGNTTGLLYTEPAVIIAMTHVLLPYTTLIIKASLDQIDPSLVRAARTLGAGPVRAYLRIYMPLATPAIVSSAMLVFIMGLGYYITPALVGGSGQTTIAMLIEQNVSVTFQWGVAATLATLLLIASLVLFALVRRFTKSTGGVMSV